MLSFLNNDYLFFIMKKFRDYFNLSLLEKQNILRYEYENLLKLYVADSIDDLIDNFESIEHSKNGLLEVILPKAINISLLNISKEESVRELYFNLLGFKVKDFEYNYPYCSVDCSEFPSKKDTRIGINIFVLEDLYNNNNSQGFARLDNATFSHFQGQRFPELINYDVEIIHREKIVYEKLDLNSISPLKPSFILS